MGNRLPTVRMERGRSTFLRYAPSVYLSNPDDIPLLDTDPGAVRANAYDMVINGVEVGGGSIRIHDSQLQDKMFKLLGFTEERAQEQFGFLMNAFKYGAPPHGGLAYGLDRFVSLFAGLDSIRDCIAFRRTILDEMLCSMLRVSWIRPSWTN